MKKNIFLLLMGIMIMFRLEGHVNLTFPEGGESFHPGDILTVTWTEVVQHNFLYWHLLFSADGGTSWDTLQANMPLEKRDYQWTVPYVQTDKARLKIVQDNESTDYEGVSFNFTITSTTGLAELPNVIRLSMSPNPMSDYTTIAFDNSLHSTHTIIIYNTQGKVVRSIPHITSDRVQVERKDLPAGFYFVRLRDDHGIRAIGKLLVE